MEPRVIVVLLLLTGMALAVPTINPAQQAADNIVSNTEAIIASLATKGKVAEELVADVNQTLQYVATFLDLETVSDEELRLFLELAIDEFSMIQKGTDVTDLEDRLGKVLTLLNSVSHKLRVCVYDGV
nr:hypothetical protein BaRGS_001016 [Batillaria attramentaria]